MTLDFTAIDFETANSYRGSPCSVGMAKVRDGRIVDESSTLIHPPARFDYFDGFNTWLHGIDAEMVADAASWQQVIGRIIRYTESDTLVCHNAGFRHWRDPLRLHRRRYPVAVDRLPVHFGARPAGLPPAVLPSALRRG